MIKLKKLLRNERGFIPGFVMELNIVIAITAILAAIAIPIIRRFSLSLLWILVVFLPLFFYLASNVLGAVLGKSDDETTIRGIYQESKGGPVVDGVLLFDRHFEEKYRGKTVEVTGNLYKDHELKCEPYEPDKPVKTCFDGPIMKNAKIRVVVSL